MLNQNTVLCVDDEKDIVDCLADTFAKRFNVKTATNGLEALDIFDCEDIALVIADQRMQEMHGIDLLTRIRRKNSLCKNILLIDYADNNAAVEAIELGVIDRYFNKPWDDVELLDTSEHLVKMYNLERLAHSALDKNNTHIASINTLKRELEAFKTLLSCLPTGACVLDQSGKVIHISSKGLEILGCEDNSLVLGKHYRDLFLIRQDQEDKFAVQSCADDSETNIIEIILDDATTTTVSARFLFASNKDGGADCRGIFFGTTN